MERPLLDAHLEGRRIVVDTPVELHMANDGLWGGHSLTLTAGPGSARIEGTVQQEARPTSEAVLEALELLTTFVNVGEITRRVFHLDALRDALATLTAATHPTVPQDRLCPACGEMMVSLDTAEAAQELARSFAIPQEVVEAWERVRRDEETLDDIATINRLIRGEATDAE